MKVNQPQHTSFVVERDLPGSPSHAFRFWAEPHLKARWNSCHPDWTILQDEADFRVGGAEAKRWRTPDGDELTFHAFYLDIVEGERIIYAYEMSFAGVRLSASLVTIELHPKASGTRMKFTEQAVFLGPEGTSEQRVQGTEQGFDRLIEEIRREVEPVDG